MKRIAAALAVDVAAVVVFAAVGRRSHDHDVPGSSVLAGLAGLAHTAWPFLAALGVGWVVAVLAASGARRPADVRPADVRPAGAVVWVVTVLVGHGLRLLSGQGSAWSFLVVTAVVLGVLLLGWRAAAGWAGRRPSRRPGRLRPGRSPGSRSATPGAGASPGPGRR